MESLKEILTVAYGVMGVAALIAYYPQLRVFLRDTEACKRAPVITWVLWVVQTAVFFLYAVVVNGDPIFMLLQGGFLVAVVACLVAVLRGRRGMKPARNRRVGVLPPR
jgi:hypothetical protein